MITAILRLDDVERGLVAMHQRGLRPIMQVLKAPLKVDQLDHAQHQRGPEGAWPARAASTMREYAKPSNRRLLKKPLGKLSTQVSYKTTSHSAIAESRVAWSLAQQDGAVVGRGSKLPPRPFLWISDQMLELASTIMTGQLADAFGGG